ncbi:hypothetical protein SAMN02745226_01127 [Fervidobacterium gondwanense DSM 13020]|uniref:Uncharacterized protein n=1 Tax=Fervidobacterium gondwanense DSM 13020 TaxID=1121883 RepID=A0A1M7SQ85_FERGO|nr:hypothetical protein SAMN02745226_01127 [Fervidobacterium gondwanense DSM 13020]
MLFENRLKIPTDYLSGERDFVHIAQSHFQSDYKEFLEAVESGDLKRAESMYTGPLLDGINDDWVKKYRLTCQKMFEELNYPASQKNLDKENNPITKLKAILEQQKLTREKHFIPLLLRKDEVIFGFSVRKGDILVDFEDIVIIVLEKGTKSYEKTIKGFLKRAGLTEQAVKILDENGVLEIIKIRNSDSYEKKDFSN